MVPLDEALGSFRSPICQFEYLEERADYQPKVCHLVALGRCSSDFLFSDQMTRARSWITDNFPWSRMQHSINTRFFTGPCIAYQCPEVKTCENVELFIDNNDFCKWVESCSALLALDRRLIWRELPCTLFSDLQHCIANPPFILLVACHYRLEPIIRHIEHCCWPSSGNRVIWRRIWCICRIWRKTTYDYGYALGAD
jgi:hypothetical protein